MILLYLDFPFPVKAFSNCKVEGDGVAIITSRNVHVMLGVVATNHRRCNTSRAGDGETVANAVIDDGVVACGTDNRVAGSSTCERRSNREKI